MQSTVTADQQRLAQLRAWRQQLNQTLSPLAWTLYVIWVLFMIAMPHILNWGNQGTIALSLSISVVLQSVLVLAVLWPVWGAVTTIRAAVVVAVLSWGMEAIGASTGFPFGSYDYTDKLQPQLFHET